MTIKAVREDAERKQLKAAAVRYWLDNLEDASYDIDDMLDECRESDTKLRMKKAETFDAQPKVCRPIAFYLFYYYK